jgi:N-acyl-D-aspartate/D-glutamate deacylase
VANIAHHPIKVFVMGPEAQDRFASAAEMAEQRRILREALEAGAQGISVFNGVAHWGPGGKPVPSRLTFPEQYDEFIAVIDEFGRGGMDVNNGPGFNTQRALTLIEKYNITWNHSPIDPAVAHEMALKGVRWHPQLSVLPNSFEVGLEDPFMFAIDQAIQRATPLHDLFNPLTKMTPAQRLEQYQREEFRNRFVEETSVESWMDNFWPLLIVSYFPEDTEQEGKRLVQLAQEQHSHPGAVMLDQAVASHLEARWVVENRLREPEQMLELYRHNRAIRLGNGDAGAHQGQIADYRWPTVMLSKWVRDYGLPLERAIQLMSSASAASYGLIDRGTLEEGSLADVVVFDPDTVQDGPLQRVSDLPGGARRLFSDAIGIDYVIVNGVPIRDHGATVVAPDALPGTLIRDFLPNSRRSIPEIAEV